jgi:hypothetical protein
MKEFVFSQQFFFIITLIVIWLIFIYNNGDQSKNHPSDEKSKVLVSFVFLNSETGEFCFGQRIWTVPLFPLTTEHLNIIIKEISESRKIDEEKVAILSITKMRWTE